MKFKRSTFLGVAIIVGIPILSGCAAKMFEEEINVVFMNEGKIVDNGVVTQFKNIQSPTIDESYVPSGYRFLGWTTYKESEMDYSSSTAFKSQYIGAGRMVHYSDVKEHINGSTVVYNALIMDKNEIPKDYHYFVMAWYNKPATSGITEEKMATYEGMVKAYLINEGVSQEDIDSIVFRGYSGNVGPTTGQILYDDDVDIMFGWGSVENITTTGSIPTESIKESVKYTIEYNGETKNRYIHRLTDSVGGLKLMEYLTSDASTSFFSGKE